MAEELGIWAFTEVHTMQFRCQPPSPAFSFALRREPTCSEELGGRILRIINRPGPMALVQPGGLCLVGRQFELVLAGM